MEIANQSRRRRMRFLRNRNASDIKYQLIGWILFVVCAIFYLVAGIQSGNLPTIIGSLIFFIACVVFMIPVFRRFRKRR